MSFDIPKLHFPDHSPEAQVIEGIVTRDHVSPGEAVRRALRGLAKDTAVPRAQAKDRKGKRVAPLTDEELANLDRLCPALKLLDEVTDETWDQIAKGARRMNREGFSNRA